MLKIKKFLVFAQFFFVCYLLYSTETYNTGDGSVLYGLGVRIWVVEPSWVVNFEPPAKTLDFSRVFCYWCL